MLSAAASLTDVAYLPSVANDGPHTNSRGDISKQASVPADHPYGPMRTRLGCSGLSNRGRAMSQDEPSLSDISSVSLGLSTSHLRKLPSETRLAEGFSSVPLP
jgi:hypothetical protein